jgi:hypothetical protein
MSFPLFPTESQAWDEFGIWQDGPYFSDDQGGFNIDDEVAPGIDDPGPEPSTDEDQGWNRHRSTKDSRVQTSRSQSESDLSKIEANPHPDDDAAPHE